MSRTAKPSGRRSAKIVGAAASIVLIGAPVAAASSVQAAPAKPYGTVIATSGLNERMFPSTDSSVKGTLAHKQEIGLRCKVRAQNIAGNSIWYLLRDRRTWVSAKYVDNHGYVKYCKEALPSKLNNSSQAAEAVG